MTAYRTDGKDHDDNDYDCGKYRYTSSALDTGSGVDDGTCDCAVAVPRLHDVVSSGPLNAHLTATSARVHLAARWVRRAKRG